MPIRWSALCVLYRYEPSLHTSRRVDDKTFSAPMVGQTLSGSWEFHGKRGGATVDSQTLVAGTTGLHFGCKHEKNASNPGHIACLRPGALDPEEPMFDDQVINRLRVPDLSRCLTIDSTDEFDSFIFEVFGHVSRASLDGDRSPQRSLRIQRAKRFIEQHAFEDIALGDIAASINVSPFTCLRQFKALTGVTPHSYLSRLRLTRAQQLLKDHRLTIGEIGSRVGIRDRFYFTRWFSREVGISPGRYRNLGS
ncbi:MAG TPA: AraC family transcriptional regulator [Candidatus Baltobacteraceae bacterium]